MAKVYTIITPPGVSEPKDYPLLLGLQVIDLGNDQFELVQVLATAEGTGGPPKLPSFSFTNFKGTTYTWTLTATAKTEGANRSMSGTWTNTDNQVMGDEDGTWTASGTGTGDDEDAQAASA